jgi:hypothetical protein
VDGRIAANRAENPLNVIARLTALERAAEADRPCGITWAELHAAQNRVGARVLLRLHAVMGTEPHWQTVEALVGDNPARAAMDTATLREWDRQHGGEADPDTLPKLLEKLDRLAASRMRRESWP